MMRQLLVVVMLLVASVAQADGQKLYEKNCAGCHSQGTTNTFVSTINLTQMTPEDIVFATKQYKFKMKDTYSYGALMSLHIKNLTASDINEIANYIGKK